MKKSLILLLTLIAILPASLPGEAYFKSTLPEALMKSASNPGPIFVEFYADWCGYCRKMREDVFPDGNVKESLEKFYTVSINVDRDPATSIRYGVQGLPTMVVLDHCGDEIQRMRGYNHSIQFRRFLKESLSLAQERSEKSCSNTALR